MKKSVVIRGKMYDLVTKTGLADIKGNYIIPKEYDRIIFVTNDLIAAIEDRPGSGILGSRGMAERGNITQRGLYYCWRQQPDKHYSNPLTILDQNVSEQIAGYNIEFYSLQGKLELSQKVLAYYYSKNNDVLLLMDENYKWSIACVDYDSQKISISSYVKKDESDGSEVIEYDKDIDRIKEVSDGKFLIQKKGLFYIISEGGCDRIGPFDFKAIEPHTHGFVAVLENNKHGFLSYSGEVVLDYVWDEIIPNENYIEVVTKVIPEGGKARGIYSYDGKPIVPCDYLSIKSYSVFSQTIFICESKGIEDNYWYELYSMNGQINPNAYKEVDIRSNGRMVYCLAGKYGMSLYDEGMDGFKELIPCSFDCMGFVLGKKDLICVQKGKKYALYNENGTQQKPFKRMEFIPSDEKKLYVM